jgi:hypothetical protein
LIVIIEVNGDRELIDHLNMFNHVLVSILKIRDEVAYQLECLSKLGVTELYTNSNLLEQLIFVSEIESLYQDGVFIGDTILVMEKRNAAIQPIVRHERKRRSYYRNKLWMEKIR